MILVLLAMAAASATPLARHQYPAAIKAITAMLQHQDQPFWYARLGTARARLGHYSDALGAFSMGLGSPFYERQGWRDHANVLRGLGQCEEAATLRASFEATLAVPDSTLLWLDIAEDWLACGNHDRAFEAIAQAEARSEGHPDVHAVLSDVYRDQGHWVEANYHLDQALLVANPRSFRPVLSSVEHRMQVGDLVGAEEQLRFIIVGHMRDTRLFLARSAWFMLAGRFDEAQVLAERGPWADHEDVRVLCRRHAVHQGVGDVHAAAQVRRQAQQRLGYAPLCPAVTWSEAKFDRLVPMGSSSTEHR
ncbi:MAG: hypothetical protein AAGA48_10590 [Myxococcota bacterium]